MEDAFFLKVWRKNDRNMNSKSYAVIFMYDWFGNN